MSVLPYDSDIEVSVPIQFRAGLRVGYDTNVNSSTNNEVDSTYISGSMGASYGYISGRNAITLDLGAGVTTYPDQASGLEDSFYNARGELRLTHRLTERATLSNLTYVAYEFESDNVESESLNRRTDQYLFFRNRSAVDYVWTPYLSTTTSYTISGLDYDDALSSASEDRLTHIFAHIFRVAVTERSDALIEGRFKYTDYDTNPNDSLSYFGLLGWDWKFAELSRLTARVGAEFRDADVTGERTAPYASLGLTHSLTEAWSVSWLNRLALEDSEAAGTNNYTFRTNLRTSYAISDRVTTFANIVYRFSDFQDGVAGAVESDESGFIFGSGITYAINPNWSVDATYYFNLIDSSRNFRDFERNRFAVGFSAQF
ncbi:MAG: transporter [Verrucomicrobiota bacterium]